MKPVLVLGGTGHYGRQIVRRLGVLGYPVRVLSRQPDNTRQILGAHPEVIQGDITNRETTPNTLQNVNTVIIAISAFSPGAICKMRQIERDAVLDFFVQAAPLGVQRVIYLSVYDLRPDLIGGKLPESGSIKQEVENALKASSFNWTVFGLPPSIEIFFSMLRGNTMTVPGGGPPALPTVSPTDVGIIAAQAALRDDLAGQRFKLVGPEALSFPEAARRIGKAANTQIQFRKIPLALPLAARQALRLFAPFSDRAYYLYELLGFIKMLNQFPQELAAQVPKEHARLLNTFEYVPTTLEMEAQMRLKPAH